MAVFDDITGISVASGFKLQAESALDGRQQVADLAARNELVTSHGAWEGMRVYVKSEKKSYILKGSTNADWVELPDADAVSTDTGEKLDLVEVKTLAAVTDEKFSVDSVYISDAYYNNNEIIIVTNGGTVRSLKGIDGGTETGKSIALGGGNGERSIFVDDNAVWVFSLPDTKLYKLNRTTLAKIEEHTFGADEGAGESIVDKCFAIFGNTMLYVLSIEENMVVTKQVMQKDLSTINTTLTPFAASTLSAGTNVAIYYDYLNPDVCAITIDDEIFVTPEYDYEEGEFPDIPVKSACALEAPTAMSDYFNYFYIEALDTSGLSLKLHDLTNDYSFDVNFESETLPVGNSTAMQTILIKKKTLDNKLQFYIGYPNGIHLKFVVNLEGAVGGDTLVSRLMYEFIDPNMKDVKLLRVDDLKNTEKVMAVYDTMLNNIRILSENVEVAGATQLSKMYDDLRAVEKEAEDIDSLSSTISSLNITVTNMNDVVTNCAFKARGWMSASKSLDTYNTAASFGIYGNSGVGSYTPPDVPLARAASEVILMLVYGMGKYLDNGIVQTLFYTKQHKQYMRYYDGSTWSDWTVVGGGTPYAVCDTAAATLAKTVDSTGFTLSTGAKIVVKFTLGSTASAPTLNVTNTGAKPIQYRGAAISTTAIKANSVHTFVYTGTAWELVGDLDTTYAVADEDTDGLMSSDDRVKMDMLMPIFVSATEPENAPENSLWFKVIED